MDGKGNLVVSDTGVVDSDVVSGTNVGDETVLVSDVVESSGVLEVVV